jgi:hypothetical protein
MQVSHPEVEMSVLVRHREALLSLIRTDAAGTAGRRTKVRPNGQPSPGGTLRAPQAAKLRCGHAE